MTSGASETILRNFFSRSSRATGPKTRVPTGSLASLMTTAAFWSKRIYVPSRRRYSLRVRTITAFTTLPFFTVPSGDASLTAAVTTSPRPAFLPRPPPRGRITCSLRAPELSATSRIVLICTDIVHLLVKRPGAYHPFWLISFHGASATCLTTSLQQQLRPSSLRRAEQARSDG